MVDIVDHIIDFHPKSIGTINEWVPTIHLPTFLNILNIVMKDWNLDEKSLSKLQ